MCKYCKILIISPGLIFVQKALLGAYFWGSLLYFGGAYYWREFSISKWVGLNNKSSFKHKDNSLKQLTLTVHGFIFRRAYYWKDSCVCDLGGLFSEGQKIFLQGLIIRIFRYNSPLESRDFKPCKLNPPTLSCPAVSHILNLKAWSPTSIIFVIKAALK